MRAFAGWSDRPRVCASSPGPGDQGAVQPWFVPHGVGGMKPLKVWAQSALLGKELPTVRSGALTVAACQTASMPKPWLKRMVLLVRSVAGGTYSVSIPPTMSPAASTVPTGRQLVELSPVEVEPAYSMTT